MVQDYTQEQVYKQEEHKTVLGHYKQELVYRREQVCKLEVSMKAQALCKNKRVLVPCKQELVPYTLEVVHIHNPLKDWAYRIFHMMTCSFHMKHPHTIHHIHHHHHHHDWAQWLHTPPKTVDT